MRAGFRILPHTSEMGLEVTAPDWASFYRCAAEGLLAIYGLRPGKHGTAEVDRSFAAETPEDIVVSWLTELIFLIGTEKLVPAKIEVLKAGPQDLRVVIKGNRGNDISLAREIKAVTYHGLEVESGRSGMKARIILDL
ncbi:MAG: archease [Elusimicrobia bacterium]|nr:archease [Elusimicrobiota bacterium]